MNFNALEGYFRLNTLIKELDKYNLDIFWFPQFKLWYNCFTRF
jgi:hypothetical protein